MEQNKEYGNIIKSIVKKYGGYREQSILKSPYIIRKAETWNDSHKVLDINNTLDHKKGFSVDIVTNEICG